MVDSGILTHHFWLPNRSDTQLMYYTKQQRRFCVCGIIGKTCSSSFHDLLVFHKLKSVMRNDYFCAKNCDYRPQFICCKSIICSLDKGCGNRSMLSTRSQLDGKLCGQLSRCHKKHFGQLSCG